MTWILSTCWGSRAQLASCSHGWTNSASVPCATELQRSSVPRVGSACSGSSICWLSLWIGEVDVLGELLPAALPLRTTALVFLASPFLGEH